MNQNINDGSPVFRIAILVFGIALAQGARAQEIDRPSGTHPMEMRPMNTDRPDVTESPYTVDRGHVQVELSVAEYSATSEHPTDHQLSILPTNLKMGVRNDLDLQLVFEPYRRFAVAADDGHRIRRSGFGAVEFRVKRNLWGNTGDGTAGGVMPFIRFPGGAGDDGVRHLEGGVILPFASALPRDFDVGAMAEIDVNRNAQDTGYGVDLTHSVTLGHALGVVQLDGYVEYVGVASVTTGASYQAYVDAGFTRAVHENLQLDGGINFGGSSREYTVFSGLSIRF